MPETDFNAAMSEIRQACENSENAQYPFFVIAGAGVSAPTIPLAAEIEAECRGIAVRYSRNSEPTHKTTLDTYSHWFGSAFPHAEQRQRYLRDKIENRLISPAVFRLAHLLINRSVGNLVITPNFDDFLSRALSLFGQPHIICDHPSTIGRISIESTDIQIVHVHGTYWFYDCCNLRDEIQQRADNPRSGSATIASFLEHLLWNRSPLVIGYSGWEGDVIMGALKRRLLTRMPFNLYWFCYHRASFDLLPQWLKSNPDVRFVLPPPDGSQIEQSPAETKFGLSDIQTVNISENPAPTLSAQKIFDSFVSVFGLNPPLLTQNPLRFLAERLRGSFLQDTEARSEGDVYSLKSVIVRVEAAIKAEATQRAMQSAFDSKLETIRKEYVLGCRESRAAN